MKTLVLGGARSGKSRYAESLALRSTKTPCLVATAEARDEEMRARIARHREQRSTAWTVREEPIQLADTIRAVDDSNHIVVVDCLTLWLANCLEKNCWEAQNAALSEALEKLNSDLILVSNEVGNGIVPLGESTRRFVDESGWLHQALAARCERVVLVTAGLPQLLKGEPEE